MIRSKNEHNWTFSIYLFHERTGILWFKGKTLPLPNFLFLEIFVSGL